MFNEVERRKIAGAAGVGEKAVARLLGSVKVRRRVQSQEPELPKFEALELGLCLAAKDLLGRVDRTSLLEQVTALLCEYQRICPVAVAWIGRGDFDPARLPDSMSGGVLLHACRTAGRLRAKIFRGLRSAV